jgi:hypothetical protein
MTLTQSPLGAMESRMWIVVPFGGTQFGVSQIDIATWDDICRNATQWLDRRDCTVPQPYYLTWMRGVLNMSTPDVFVDCTDAYLNALIEVTIVMFVLCLLSSVLTIRVSRAFIVCTVYWTLAIAVAWGLLVFPAASIAEAIQVLNDQFIEVYPGDVFVPSIRTMNAFTVLGHTVITGDSLTRILHVAYMAHATPIMFATSDKTNRVSIMCFDVLFGAAMHWCITYMIEYTVSGAPGSFDWHTLPTHEYLLLL